jgi:YgiT-type zinc finger domain-containing protein
MNLPDLALCYECGGHLYRVARADRTTSYLGKTCQVPADLALLTCDSCGHEWTTADDEEAIEAACS